MHQHSPGHSLYSITHQTGTRNGYHRLTVAISLWKWGLYPRFWTCFVSLRLHLRLQSHVICASAIPRCGGTLTLTVSIENLNHCATPPFSDRCHTDMIKCQGNETNPLFFFSFNLCKKKKKKKTSYIVIVLE